MPYTFGQAKRKLADYASSHELGDIGAAINTAVEELATSKNWQNLRRVKRFAAYGQYFPIPQDCESVIRACVNGKPISMHGVDYDFLSSGPGDLDYIEAGYAPTHGIQDTGFYPTMYDLTDPDGARLCAFGTGDLSGEAIRVKGKNQLGEITVADVYYKTWADADLGTAAEDAVAVAAAVDADATTAGKLFCEIDKVVLPEGADAYIHLYALVDGVFTFLSSMHPSERIPSFRRYRLAGFSSEADAYYSVLAEVKLKAIPMVNDWDPMPFESLLPVQYMLQSMWQMNSGEIKAADDYRQRAILALMTREDSQQERQSMVILNTHYDGSLGQASEELYDNI